MSCCLPLCIALASVLKCFRARGAAPCVRGPARPCLSRWEWSAVAKIVLGLILPSSDGFVLTLLLKSCWFWRGARESVWAGSWLAGWLTGRLAGRLAGWLASWLAGVLPNHCNCKLKCAFRILLLKKTRVFITKVCGG